MASKFTSSESIKYWNAVKSPAEPNYARLNRLIGHFTFRFKPLLRGILQSDKNLRDTIRVIEDLYSESIPALLNFFSKEDDPSEVDENHAGVMPTLHSDFFDDIF